MGKILSVQDKGKCMSDKKLGIAIAAAAAAIFMANPVIAATDATVATSTADNKANNACKGQNGCQANANACQGFNLYSEVD